MRCQTYNDMLDEQENYESRTRVALLQAESTLENLKTCKDCEGKFKTTRSRIRCIDCFEMWVKREERYLKM